MDQTLDQIEAHIGRTRAKLGSNLEELEDKVQSATDFRVQYRARPYVMLGAAAVGGLLLAATLRPRGAHRHASAPSTPRRGFDARGQVLDTWDNVAAALLGVASSSVKNYIAAWVPGFDEQFTRASQR